MVVCPSQYDDIRPNLHFFQYMQAKKPCTNPVLINTKLYWPSTTKYQSVPLHTDQAPPTTNQNRLILTQYYHVSTSSSSYWPSNMIFQPVLPHTDTVPPSTKQYRLLLTKYNHVSTSSVPYWPKPTKYQPALPSTVLVKSYIIFKCQTFLYRPEMSTVVR